MSKLVRQFTIKVTPEEYRDISKLAKIDNRTVSGYVRDLLIKQIKESINLKEKNKI